MLARLFRWRRRAAAPAAVFTAPPPAVVVSPPATPPAAAAPSSGTTLGVEPDPALVEAAARAELAATFTALVDAFDAGERRTDAVRVATAVAEGGDAAIRQPPAAARDALVVSRDPNCTPADLVRLAEANPMLAQGLFKAANSAYYASGGAACGSLREAVRRLGSSGVTNVVLATMVEGLVCRPGAAYQPMVDQVWSHMVRTAPLTRALAPAFGVAPDEAFAAGLLHDLGKLVVFDAVAVLRGELRREVELAPATLARLLRATHEPIGAIAAVRWGMGSTTAQAIGAHHAATPLPTPRADRLRQLVNVAERAELAFNAGVPLELPEWWSAVAGTGPLQHVERLLNEALAASRKE